MPRREAATWLGWLVLALLGLAGGAVCWNFVVADEPAPIAVNDTASLPDSAPSLAAAVPAAAPPTGERIAVPARSIVGHVFDAAGAPLAGVQVVVLSAAEGKQLELASSRFSTRALTKFPLLVPGSNVVDPAEIAAGRRAPPLELDRVATGDDGSFAFVGLLPGDYRVELAASPRYQQVVKLVAESVSVELRLVADEVLVTGSLLQQGLVSNRHRVTFRAEQGVEYRGQPVDGVIRLVLPAGRYEASVQQLGRDLQLSTHRFVVPVGVRACSFTFPVGGTEIVVGIRMRNGGSVPPFGVDVNRVDSDLADPTYFAGTAAGETATLPDLAPGRWRVHAHSPGLLLMPAREVEVGSAGGRLELWFDSDAAEAVYLRCVVGGDRQLSPPPELLPSLLAGGVELPCVQIKVSDLLSNRPPLGYEHVPVGSARLQWSDRVHDGEQMFLPFDPPAPCEIEVIAGRRNEIVVPVSQRALVDLRVCERSGREDVSAQLVVRSEGRFMRSRERRLPQRFLGWLPPGDYGLVITREGVTAERSLRVDRRDITLRLRP